MKKIVVRSLGVVLIGGLLASCSGPKQITEQQVVKAAVNTPVDELAEQKQQEFEYLFVEALKQNMFGNPQKAIQLLSSCLSIDPNSSSAMYELANIHAANNDFTSASLLLEKAIALEPDNKWYKLLLAQIYQQTRKFSEASDIYAELLKSEPDNLEYLYMNAALLTNSNRYDESIAAYNRLEKETGINEQISVAKQQVFVSMGKIDKAFEEIQKLIDSNPSDPKYYGLLADLYQSQGDKENALKYYQKILKMDPENGFVHFSLANYYFEAGDLNHSFEETKEGFESESVDLQTKLQWFMMLTSNQGGNQINEKQQDELIQILLKVHPDESLVYTVYAESLLKKNMLAEARTELLKALSIEKNDYMIWERVMYLDNDLQEWNDLYAHTKEIMELFPNQPQGYFFHAIACVQLEKFDETIAVVDEGLDYVVQNPQLKGNFLMLKGEALHKENKKEDAYKLFDEALEADPENYLTLNNYAYYLSEDGKDLDKAERMSGKVVERFSDNSTYLDTHAWVLFKKGEYKLAKFYMESALKNGGEDNATLLEHYGDILFMLQKLDEAKSYWEKAKDNGGNSEVLLRKIKEERYIEE